MGDHEEAISHYAKALAINPNYSTARQNLELVLSEMPNEDVVFTQPVALEEKNPIKETPVKIQQPIKITNEKSPNILEQLETMFSSLGNILGISN